MYTYVHTYIHTHIHIHTHTHIHIHIYITPSIRGQTLFQSLADSADSFAVGLKGHMAFYVVTFGQAPKHGVASWSPWEKFRRAMFMP